MDITPFLSIFHDGKPHYFSFNITPAANSFWLVDGNLKVFEGEKSTGRVERIYNPNTVPRVKIRGRVEDKLKVKVNAKSRFEASGILYHSDG
jgi:hypothetical protein